MKTSITQPILATLFALSCLSAYAVHPTQGPLQNDPALCAYGYNTAGNCGYHYGGSQHSYSPPPTRTYSPQEEALIKDNVTLNDAQNPIQCTQLPNGWQRCWRAWYARPSNSNLERIYPKIELYMLDGQGKQQGWQLDYGRGKLLWANYWKDNQPYPTGSKSYNFHDAPKNQANVTERLNDRQTTGDKGWGQTLVIPQAQAVQELGLKSMSLQDAIHPDDFKQLLQAEKYLQEVERAYLRKYQGQ